MVRTSAVVASLWGVVVVAQPGCSSGVAPSVPARGFDLSDAAASDTSRSDGAGGSSQEGGTPDDSSGDSGPADSGGNCNKTNPFDWLDAFFAACTGCRVDYVALHWNACTKEALVWYLGQAESKYQRLIWLTEFACLDGSDTTEPTQRKYMKDALDVLETDPMVFRYAWFTGRYDKNPALDLLGASGQLTALGQQYVSAPQRCKP